MAHAGEPPASLGKDWVIRSWTTSDGLPHSTVNAIVQTRDGYLWLGTSGGLARFDGVRFRTFGLQDGLRSVRISALLEDSRGTLWAGTSAGLSRWENGRFLTLTRHDGLVNETISALAEGADQAIWIGTEQGLQQWRNGVFSAAISIDGGPARHIRALQRDASGVMWASSIPHGLLHVVDDRLVFPGGKPPQPGVAYCILADGKQGVFVGSGDGLLWRFRDGAWTRQGPANGLPKSNIDCMAQGAQGPLWVGGALGLCYSIDGAFEQVTQADGLSDNAIRSLLVDREGTLWVGTTSGGLNRLSRRFIRHWGQAQGLEGPAVTSVIEDASGVVWAATRSAGGYRLENGRFSRINDPAVSGNYPYLYTSLMKRDGSIWMAGESCLFRFMDGQPTLAFHDTPIKGEAIRALCEDDNALWLGTYSSTLMKVEGGSITVVAPKGSFGSDITALIREAPGILWIGTHNGLHLWQPGSTRTWGTGEGLISAAVRSLYRDPDGALWIGTEGGGLARLKDGRIACITTRDGLREDIVNQIVADDRGRLWLGGHRGVTRVLTRELNDLVDGRITYLHVAAFGKNEGVACEQFSGGHSPTGVMTSTGRLLLPTLRGLIEIEPHKESVSLAAPHVRIEDVLVDGRIQASTSPLVLPPGGQKLEVSYSALSLLASDAIQFRVKLDGLDRDWIEMGDGRMAGYNHIPPGHYTLQITACDSEGNWSANAASLAIVVRPHYWQTAWFKAMLLAAGAATVGFVWHRYAAALRRKRRMQDEFTRQLIIAQESERKRLAFELHDGLGQDLMLIKNRLAMAMGRAQGSPDVARQLSEITDTTSRAIADVRSISHGLRPSALEQAGLTQAIEWMVQQVSESSGMKVLSELENIDRVFPADAEINLYRIVQEALNNVVRHSQATEAIVTIRRESGAVMVSVFDNGRGIEPWRPDEPHNGRTSFGLIGMAERAKLLGGRIEIQSAPGKGTRLSAWLPVTRKE